jgi:hypothetical protein
MMRLLLPVVLAVVLSGCSNIDQQASQAVVGRFHSALNAGDWATIDSLLSQSTRNLRPGGATARAFRAITQRHGQYVSGKLARIENLNDTVTIAWTARYDKGPVAEFFVLVEEDGGIKIDSYSDKAGS